MLNIVVVNPPLNKLTLIITYDGVQWTTGMMEKVKKRIRIIL